MTEPLIQPSRTSPRASTTRSAEDPQRADPLSYSDITDNTGIGPDRESPPSTPRWVKWFGITAIVLVLLFAGLHVNGSAPTHMPGTSGPEHSTQAP